MPSRGRRWRSRRKWWLRGSQLTSLIATVIFAPASLSAAETSIAGDSYAVLDRGQKGAYEWRIFTSPMNGSRTQSLPCIDVSVERKLRPISEAAIFESCGTIKPFPIIMQVAVGKGKKKVTVAGMAFDRRVRMVK